MENINLKMLGFMGFSFNYLNKLLSSYCTIPRYKSPIKTGLHYVSFFTVIVPVLRSIRLLLVKTAASLNGRVNKSILDRVGNEIPKKIFNEVMPNEKALSSESLNKLSPGSINHFSKKLTTLDGLEPGSVGKNNIGEPVDEGSSKSPILTDFGSVETVIKEKNIYPEECFERLKTYLIEKYPKFPINKYKNFETFENVGHPLHFAIQENDSILLCLLIDAGCNVNKQDGKGNTPMLLFVRNVLAKKKPRDLMRPRQWPSFARDFDKMRENGADLFLANVSGQSPFELLAEYHLLANKPTKSDERLLELLPEKGLTSKALKGMKHLLNHTSSEKVITFLKENGIDIDTPDKCGRTPLYRAVLNGKLKLACFLRKLGANSVYNPNKSALTPVKLAEKNLEALQRLIENIVKTHEKEGLEMPKDDSTKFSDKMERRPLMLSDTIATRLVELRAKLTTAEEMVYILKE